MSIAVQHHTPQAAHPLAGPEPVVRPRLGTAPGQPRHSIPADGARLVWRKLIALAQTILAVPVVLCLRLLRPVLTIRVGALPSSRIGPFSAAVEIYLCERDAGLHGRRVVDLFYHALPISNAQLKAMWDRTVPVARFVGALARVNRWFPGAAAHQVPMRIGGDRDLHGLLAGSAPHLRFTADELRRGWDALRAYGMDEHTPYVCFQARESRYLAATYPDRDWDYHNYRNAQVRHMLPAVDALTQRRYVALRVGALVDAPLETANPRIIDYATTGRTEFLDIFLEAHCRFYLGDPAGIAGVPLIFRRPIAFTNFIPFEYVNGYNPQDIFIPKKLWLRAEHRWLTFREILRDGIGRFQSSAEYERLGIDVIENTPEEITALALEMDARINGTWQPTPEDEELQRAFWSLFAGSRLNGVIRSHVGAEFLRQHVALLE